MPNNYIIGNVIRLEATFTVGGVAADPTTIALTVQSPSGVIDEYTGVGATIVRESAGTFSADITPDEVGRWEYRWEGTGAAQAASEGRFYITPSGIEEP